MQLGVIGVGHLAGALLGGLLRSGMAAGDIVLSPRGKGPQRAARDGHVLARDNADLVTRCDMVILSVRPGDAAGAVAGLPWRAGQIVLNACAGVPIAALDVGPATVVRIMPITAAELGASPTLVYPPEPRALDLLARLGAPVPLQGEAQFETATVSAAIYGWAQALIRGGADWSEAQGLDPETARQLVARTFVAAGRMIAEKDVPMDRLLADLVTPGGITEAGLKHLEAAGVPQAWDGACDVVRRKLSGS
ncbi:pyrroline-5-carboxylate reductase family protein [Salipiger sp.]|uniref:pyrroline-5-carboxylate reductase family protein n=1 Tax=Salipiger sp. TaxID=2078585 RepID=UPI003A974BD7